jgi:hypothetical protein
VLGTVDTAMTAERISDKVAASLAVAVSRSCVVAKLSGQVGLKFGKTRPEIGL